MFVTLPLLSALALASAPAMPDQTVAASAPPGADASPTPPANDPPASDPASHQSGTDIFSRDTFTGIIDLRLAAANGERSFTQGGFGKTRFSGSDTGGYKAYAAPVEADLVWNPRFTPTLSANVSAAWQRSQQNKVDLIEAFVNYLPPQTGKVGIQLRAGLMWPEISLEHSTGGAWSVVNTITPSAINSWVGEEIKVVGAEATLRFNFGQNELALTGAAFSVNDTAGTLLSFRGWALDDVKATGFGHFPLPPLNPFIRLLQEDQTRSTINLDNRVGYYVRLAWRPPAPIAISAFYYDNDGNPQKFDAAGQWGWRTRFGNVGLSADLTDRTQLLAQGMAGSTIMGFSENGQPWVHTYYRSAFAELVHHVTDRLSLTGRVEAFGTREHGSEMPSSNSEDGWSTTAAARYTLSSHFTLFVEALNVRSRRGNLADVGLAPFQAQTVFQASLRVRL